MTGKLSESLGTQNNMSVISQQQLTWFMSFLGFTSTSTLSFGKGLRLENPEDPVWLEPSTPGLQAM